MEEILKVIKCVISDDIVYVSKENIDSCVKSIFGGYGAELLMELIEEKEDLK